MAFTIENYWWISESCTPLLWLLLAWSFSKLHLHQYLPLFFVLVKTNVNYQVVALFILQDETTAAITEALSVIKTWNPTWDPKWFMVDKCDKDIKSIGNISLRTYMNCFNLFVLIKNLFIAQNTMHFWKCAKKYQEWFGFGFKEIYKFLKFKFIFCISSYIFMRHIMISFHGQQSF